MIEAAILSSLTKGETQTPISISAKKLRKAVMKPHKAAVPDKKERKTLFRKVADGLHTKGKIQESDGEYVLMAQEAKSSSTKKDDAVAVAVDKNETKEYPKEYPPDNDPKDSTILLFYAYSDPQMRKGEQDKAIASCYGTLNSLGVTGRLRIGREGFNGTLTGSYSSIREFTTFLKKFQPATFGNTDFKYVDHLHSNQLLKGLKVFPVAEIVTYGFNPDDAPLDKRGVHLTPQEWTEKMKDPNAVVIDVRNFNETLIGKFCPGGAAALKPPGQKGEDEEKEKNKKEMKKEKKRKREDPPAPQGATVLDPCMRRSTDFPLWVQANKEKLQGRPVLMYCTAGVRCERASAFLKNQGLDDVYQLDGGIHRYLDAYPEDGGLWVGKNYTFDKRFNHGAEQSEIISFCVNPACEQPWARYQAQKKCFKCKMEVLLCKECQKMKPAIPNSSLICPLCKDNR